MTPPVLLDLTGDGVVDIVFATYNSTLVALDGQCYTTLWNFTYPLSETYASVTYSHCRSGWNSGGCMGGSRSG